MKNQNGYGTVVKLSGNRRKPYTVRKTLGFNEKGHPVYMSIGYFSTREQGLIALAEYNKEPFNVELCKITLGELFSLWREKRAQKLGECNKRNLIYAYKHIKHLENMKYTDIKSFYMQESIDNCGFGYSTQHTVKNLWVHLDNFAFELDIIRKKYSQILTADSVPETSRVPFSEDEIKCVWQISDKPFVDSVLILLYTGMRISEMLSLETANVDLNTNAIKCGIKTKAGKNRIIPIHPLILPFVEKRVKNGGYLFGTNEKPMPLSKYYGIWKEVMQLANLNHTPHECRHTFETRLDSAGANRRCIDLLMGHASKDVGNRIYNHKTILQLREAVEMLKK